MKLGMLKLSSVYLVFEKNVYFPFYPSFSSVRTGNEQGKSVQPNVQHFICKLDTSFFLSSLLPVLLPPPLLPLELELELFLELAVEQLLDSYEMLELP